jgi:hypothetical protein
MPASLETFRASDLEPLATLALEPEASEGKSANFGDRAAVLYEVGGGSTEASLRIRCLAIPR